MQQPGPPIIIGGHGAKRTPALTAQFAAEFNREFASVDDSRAAFERVRAACEAIDRDPATLVLSAAQVVCCGADEAEFQRRAAAIGREPDELRENGAAGTPDEVIARLHEFAAAAPRAPTSRSSTCPTSTTSASSPTRSSPTSDRRRDRYAPRHG